MRCSCRQLLRGDEVAGSVRSIGRSARAIAGSAVLGASLVLTACAGSTPIRYHALEAVAPSMPPARAAAGGTAYAGPALRVGAVRIPPVLDRRELVRTSAPGRVEVLEFDHWAAPLGRLSRQVLTEDLASRLPEGALAYPGAPSALEATELTIDILSFKVEGGVATMLASWSARRASSAPPSAVVPASASAAAGARNAPATPATSASPEAAAWASAADVPLPAGAALRLQTPSSDGADASVWAFSELIGQLAGRIVDGLSRSAVAR